MFASSQDRMHSATVTALLEIHRGSIASTHPAAAVEAGGWDLAAIFASEKAVAAACFIAALGVLMLLAASLRHKQDGGLANWHRASVLEDADHSNSSNPCRFLSQARWNSQQSCVREATCPAYQEAATPSRSHSSPSGSRRSCVLPSKPQPSPTAPLASKSPSRSASPRRASTARKSASARGAPTRSLSCMVPLPRPWGCHQPRRGSWSAPPGRSSKQGPARRWATSAWPRAAS
mmetsp:Transcript_16149/g.43493  ORF Transcript_16149/g.43493 Transcript_16149/m.43493 type:complete len:234 (-) Transcript_16149:419-1120(-)